MRSLHRLIRFGQASACETEGPKARSHGFAHKRESESLCLDGEGFAERSMQAMDESVADSLDRASGIPLSFDTGEDRGSSSSSMEGDGAHSDDVPPRDGKESDSGISAADSLSGNT